MFQIVMRQYDGWGGKPVRFSEPSPARAAWFGAFPCRKRDTTAHWPDWGA